MVVSGNPSSAWNDVEVIDLSGQMRTCNKLADFPAERGFTGTFFDGSPIVCGGSDGQENVDCSNLCYRYDRKVTYLTLFLVKLYVSYLIRIRRIRGQVPVL